MLKSVLKNVAWWPQRGAAAVPAEDGRYYSHEEIVGRLRRRAEELRASRYMGYPYFVHLETIASCNAACSFCPYPSLERKGTRMSDELIEKILGDLTAIPPDLPFTFAPYKVSEPFLDTRLFDILEQAAKKLPGARVYLSSNVAALTEKKMDQLAAASNVVVLNLSVNYDDPEEYEAVMKIPFERTLARLTALHERAAAGAYKFRIRITRVTAGRATDSGFVQWAQQNFPAFEPMIFPRNDWIGTAVTPGAHDQVPDAPCHRWFDMSITATGEVALCCMDGQCRYPKGNVKHQHLLEIYNQPHLIARRQSLLSRLQAGDPCNRCTYVSW